MDRDELDLDEQAMRQWQQQRLRAVAGKVSPRAADIDPADHVRTLHDQMSKREVQQRDALAAMRGTGAARRDGRVTPDMPDHLNGPDATVEDHIKDLERRAHIADLAEADLEQAALTQRDVAGHSMAGMAPSDPGAEADRSDELHGFSPGMSTDPANARTDPQPAVEPVKVSHERHPERAYGAPSNPAAASKARPAEKDAKKD